MTAADPVVIVGAGHGGFAVADTLRQLGYTQPITLLEAHDVWPYQRPPLSKAYLTGDPVRVPIEFRPADFYDKNGIDYIAGDRCVSIDRSARALLTTRGRRLRYRHVVLATGAEPQRLPIPGAALDGVCRLHTVRDADRVLGTLTGAARAVVIGGGFIGLEVASAARSLGVEVTVVEAATRLMQRSVSPPVSQYFLDIHRAAGITVSLDSTITAIRGGQEGLDSVELKCGTTIPADVVVVGVGVSPRTELAHGAGLLVDNGVVVDEHLLTSDPNISAIGDCCAFPEPLTGRSIRLESVQNATDHARCVAARLTGDPQPYRDSPWFWSHQGAAKVQIAGLTTGGVVHHIHGEPEQGRFSVLHLDEAGRLVCGESVNNPGDHVALRTLVAHGARMGSALHNQPDLSLKALARTVRDRHRQPAL